MIKLYFTSAEKYLEKGKYIKHFGTNVTIDDMLDCIKDKEEQVTIYALADIVFAHRYSQNYKPNYSYKVLDEIMPLDEKLLQSDLDKLYEGITSYICFQPIEKWRNVLGNKVYFTNSRSLQRSLIDSKNTLAFTLDDINELIKGLKKTGEIPKTLIYKMFYNGDYVFPDGNN